MAHRSCPICASKDARLIYDQGRGKKFDTCVCAQCGLVFVPDLSGQKGDYRKHDTYDVSKDAIERILTSEKRAMGMAERRFANLEKNVPAIFESKGRMHDIGASIGFFMNLWSEAGFDVTGCEPDEYYAKVGEAHFGFDIDACLYEERPVEESSFDVITMCHVLEHVPDPRSILKRIRTELKSDGMLYIEIPHVDRPYSGNLDRFFWIEHLNYFSIRTLEALLRSEGFKIRDTGPLGYFLWVVAEKHEYEQVVKDFPLDHPDEIKQRLLVSLLHRQERTIAEFEKRIDALEKRLN